MKIFLTGGTGFIGNYLVKLLIENKFEVHALNRNSNSNSDLLNNRVNWINKSLDEVNLNDIKGMEVIIHLASAGVSPKKASWEELEKVNIKSSLNLIELACIANVPRFIAAGTCLEYGEESNKWERIPPYATLKPITPYAVSKAKSFSLLNDFARNSNIEFIYGRVFTAYGEGQYQKNFWPSLNSAAKEGKDFYMSKGEQIRDFIPVNDVANHFLKAIERIDVLPRKPIVVNIGTGVGLSLKEFAKKEWKRLEAKGKLLPGSLISRPNEIERIVADTIGLNS